MNDNRNYKYDLNSISKREEYSIIERLLNNKSKVIDLGCGDGTLLGLLRKKKNVKIADGIEISETGVKVSKKKGLNVWQGSIDIPLKKIKDKSYDYAICNVTLQMVMYPEVLISEMLRISDKQIISFPNFAFILNRIELLLKGKMPQFMISGYKWYSTGHIHQLSILDFKDYCKQNKIKILKEEYIIPRTPIFIPDFILKLFPNLFSSMAVFLTTKGNE